ncbi:hypothetical protein MP638_005967 [Amoeboaphelidium occidentale]|nr:hypothetical protein MP638_005967 [Amoeboaphelidium occidentale]
MSDYIYFKRNQRSVGGIDKRILYTLGAGTLCLSGYYVSHLESVPSTGRRRFMSISSKEEEYMSKQAYQSVMSQFSGDMLPSYHPLSVKVERVAKRLINVSGMSGLNWEVHVVNSNEPNAFVIPGGKIFVFTGIFRVAQNDDQLAAVMGHEIGHQLARHSAEKMSFFKFAMVARLFLSLFVDTSFIFNRVFFDLIFTLPFSRQMETEADFVGLMLMAQACYDPSEAVNFWRNMDLEQKREVAQFVSTHPSSKNRIQKLKEWLPQAEDKYLSSNCRGFANELQDFLGVKWARW